MAMNPARKRTVRLTVALSAAVVLAGALIYTSFSAASPALTPSQLVRQAQPGRSYQLTGTVVGGSVRHDGGTLDFSVEDRAGGTVVPVAYTGTVPDPFKRRARGDRDRAEAGRRVCRRTELADHEVPVQVHGRAAERQEAELLR